MLPDRASWLRAEGRLVVYGGRDDLSLAFKPASQNADGDCAC